MQALRRRTVAALGAAALSVPLAATVGAPALAVTHQSTTRGQQPARISFPTTKASWATPSRATATALTSQPLTFRVVLGLRHQAQAEQAAQAVSTPGSSTYQHHLTSAQFQRQYGASDATVAQVAHYFGAQGMTVLGSDWHAVTLRAPVSAIEKTFATSVHTYRFQGHDLRGVDTAMSLPRAIGQHVLTVTGVNQSPAVRTPQAVRPTEPDTTAPSTVQPDSNYADRPTCSDYWNQHQFDMPAAYGQTSFPTYICGYVPAQLRSAYGVDTQVAAGQDGAGTKVAIIDAYGSPTIRRDTRIYFSNRGEAGFADGQYRQKLFTPFVNQDLCSGEHGWNEEQTLDVEAVHAMAPGADVVYAGASDCNTGIDDAQQWIVDHATRPGSKFYGVSIVSNSYGYPGDEPNVAVDPAQVAVEHQTLIQAATEGIGFYFSSGDQGDATPYGLSDRPQASYEASDPFATAVGGTSLAVDQAGQYLFETGWGSTLDPVTYDDNGDSTGYAQPLPGQVFAFGAGGGVSTQFAQPYYQVGTVPDTLSQMFGPAKMRVAPDVAMDADPYTGFLIGISDGSPYTESSIGGTSLAAPLFAGLQAVAQGSGPTFGFVNPLLYGLDASAFHDVVPPAQKVATPSASGHYLVTYDEDTSLTTAAGYDDVTGRGTPDGSTFFDAERGTATSTTAQR